MSDQGGIWDSVSTGLSIGGSAAGLFAAAWGAAFAVRRWLDHTVGRRHAQSERLDQLCCTSSLTYVESVLGPPQFITYANGIEERIYRLRGAWVVVHPVNDAVHWFSVTITDPKMYYDIGPMTIDTLPIRLGVSTFADAPRSDDESMQTGAKSATFVRHYRFGSAQGNGQGFWLAFNEVGCGTFEPGEPYGTGIYAPHGTYGTSPNTAAITANTLTVMSPGGNTNDLRERLMHGPYDNQVQLAIRERRNKPFA